MTTKNLLTDPRFTELLDDLRDIGQSASGPYPDGRALGGLLAEGLAGSSGIEASTAADLRTETEYAHNEQVYVVALNDNFRFDATSMAVDDGTTVIKPTNINIADPGRWVRTISGAKFSLLTDVPSPLVADTVMKVNGAGTALEGIALTTLLVGIKYSWANAAARNAQVGMSLNEMGVQRDTGDVYRYENVPPLSWVFFFNLQDGFAKPDRVLYVAEGAAAGGDGSIVTPYQDVQDAVDSIGQPLTAAEFQEKILIEVLTPGSTFIGNLDVPHRCITIRGRGLVIDGNIVTHISASRSFGVLTTAWKSSLTLEGFVDGRDAGSVREDGVTVTGYIRNTILQHSIATITGDGTDVVAVVTATPSNMVIGVHFDIAGTVAYNELNRVVLAVTDSTHFTYTSAAPKGPGFEAVGTLTETDVAGATATEYDTHLRHTYLRGAYESNDGVINAGAPNTGDNLVFVDRSWLFGGVNGAGIICQRWKGAKLEHNTFNIDSIVHMEDVQFEGALLTAILATGFVAVDGQRTFVNCSFPAAQNWVFPAAQNISMDEQSMRSWIEAVTTYVAGNVPVLLGNTMMSGTTLARPVTTLPVGFLYYDTTLSRPAWWSGAAWLGADGLAI